MKGKCEENGSGMEEEMERARFWGAPNPQNLSFLSLILQLISNGSWVNDWASIWVQIGVKMVKKSAKTGAVILQFAGGPECIF